MRHLLPLLLLASPALAAEPAVIVLAERSSCPAALVTVGHVATVTGPETWRKAVAAIDLDLMPARDASVVITRRQVEARLQVAGLKADEFRVIGAERATVQADRKPVPVEDVVIAAKAAVLHRLPFPPDEVTFDLSQPVLAKMPEIGKAEVADIRAEPNGNDVRMGRIQVNVTISCRGEKRLTLPVFLDARRVGEAAPVARAAPPPPGGGEVLVKARQPVDVVYLLGELKITVKGEAQADGKIGQAIRVRNIDSNKVLTGRVTGAGQVAVE